DLPFWHALQAIHICDCEIIKFTYHILSIAYCHCVKMSNAECLLPVIVGIVLIRKRKSQCAIFSGKRPHSMPCRMCAHNTESANFARVVILPHKRIRISKCCCTPRCIRSKTIVFIEQHTLRPLKEHSTWSHKE